MGNGWQAAVVTVQTTTAAAATVGTAVVSKEEKASVLDAQCNANKKSEQ